MPNGSWSVPSFLASVNLNSWIFGCWLQLLLLSNQKKKRKKEILKNLLNWTKVLCMIIILNWKSLSLPENISCSLQYLKPVNQSFRTNIVSFLLQWDEIGFDNVEKSNPGSIRAFSCNCTSQSNCLWCLFEKASCQLRRQIRKDTSPWARM